MTRLERFIARMQAQKALLDRVCAELKAPDGLPGPVIELGLGNGRTYDHLRARLPDRRILVFERDPQPNERSRPPETDLHVGEIERTGALFAAASPHCAALVHADLGDGTRAGNSRLERWLPALCYALARADGWVVTSTRLDHEGLVLEPSGVDFDASSYVVYRARGASAAP